MEDITISLNSLYDESWLFSDPEDPDEPPQEIKDIQDFIGGDLYK